MFTYDLSSLFKLWKELKESYKLILHFLLKGTIIFDEEWIKNRIMPKCWLKLNSKSNSAKNSIKNQCRLEWCKKFDKISI